MENIRKIEINPLLSQLAQEIEYSYYNIELQKRAIQKNRKFIEEHANYSINMKKISQTYHELINQNN